MRENRETPLLQAAIASSLAIIFATVYLRHLLPVSGISFFHTLLQSMPFSPLNAPLQRGLVSPSLKFAEALG
jgi:hypothetical protein